MADRSDDAIVAECREAQAQIDQDERQIGTLQERVSALRWRQADNIVELRSRKWSLRRIAEAIGFSEATVRRYEATVGASPATHRPLFSEAIDWQRGSHATLAEREPTDAEVVDRLVRQPELARDAAVQSDEVGEQATEGSRERIDRQIEESRAAFATRDPERHERVENSLKGRAAEAEELRLREAENYIRAATVRLQLALQSVRKGNMRSEHVTESLNRLKLHVDLIDAYTGGEIAWDAAWARSQELNKED